jgi:hypothetical protein
MKMSVWDIRQFKELGSYFTRSAASSVAISDTGLTAVGKCKLDFEYARFTSTTG